VKRANTNYCLWTLLVGLLYSSIMDAQPDWEEYQEEIITRNWNIPEKSTLEKIFGTQAANAEKITCGVVFYGVIAGIYYSLKESDVDIEEDDTEPRLSFHKRLEFLEDALATINTKHLNIKVIAAQTVNFSKTKLERFMSILKKVRCNYTNNLLNRMCSNIPFYTYSPIDMSHVQLAHDEIHGGLRTTQEFDSRELFNTAVHEAGHAIAIINNEQFILYQISIVSRRKSAGRNLLLYPRSMTIDDYKNKIIIDLSGGIAEQVFGFDRSWYAQHSHKKAEKDINWNILSKNRNICEGLSDLCVRPSAASDMTAAYTLAAYIISWQGYEKDSPDFQNQICKILEDCYQKAYLMIQSRRSEVEQIAQILIKKTIISGDEVYTALDVKRPLYVFEMRSN
jgi:hypothetical protein